MKNIIDFKALFLGSKSENIELYSQILNRTFQDAAYWRRNYHPSDSEIITDKDQNSKSYLYSKEKMIDVLNQVSANLRGGCIPWHSPRYFGHMNSETLMPGVIAYFEAMLYNSNNVAYESSPATSKMEDEIGADFCNLLGYDPKIGWGHICADGSIANYEGLWYARNFKSLPFAIKKTFPELVKNKTDWELANMSVDEILSIMDLNNDKWDVIKDNSIRTDTSSMNNLGVVMVPRTKHYSWVKAADILGIGTNNIIPIDVDENFRMDINVLEKEINTCIKKQIPIMMVVCVTSTTEEGMVDPVHKVVELRNKLMKEQNVWFYFHVDSAYGGYMRSIFLDENYKVIPFNQLQSKYKEYQVFQTHNNWPNKDVYDAFTMCGHADSITIDPHKMGYAPYAAGGIAIKNIKMRNAISYFATYVFDTKIEIPDLLGAYIFEGSKAGATAAAVWTNHRIVPLNIAGYGRLMGNSMEGALNFYDHLVKVKSYKIKDKTINVFPVINPDTNIVDFIFNYEGNNSLQKMNDLNQNIYDACSFVEGSTYTNDIVLSHSSFSNSDYGNAPLNVLKIAGITTDFKDQELIILRSCILSPWLYDHAVAHSFLEKFDMAIESKLAKII